ncbi:MAG: hypothetical protein D6681_19845, partial [Calditrichaeota bacterium]
MTRYVLIPVVAGGIATGMMTLVLWIIDRTGWTRADMVRAIGSLFTKNYQNALWPGLVTHFTAGIIFSGIYLHILSLLNLPSFIGVIFVGGVIGFIQGFAFSFIMVIMAEHHPIEEFQEADFEVAVAHVLGHIVYGMAIG